MVIAEFGCGIAGYVYKNDVGDWIGDNMKNTLVNYKKDDFESVTGAWDFIQPNFKCCGVDEFSDWKNVTSLKDAVPDSCCKIMKDNCGRGLAIQTKDQVKDKIWTEGCLQKTEDNIESNIAIVGGAAIGVAVVQLIGAIVAFFLGRRMSEDAYA